MSESRRKLNYTIQTDISVDLYERLMRERRWTKYLPSMAALIRDLLTEALDARTSKRSAEERRLNAV